MSRFNLKFLWNFADAIQAKRAYKLKYKRKVILPLFETRCFLGLSVSSFMAPVVQKLDSAIHWINCYPLDSEIGFHNTAKPPLTDTSLLRTVSFVPRELRPLNFL